MAVDFPTPELPMTQKLLLVLSPPRFQNLKETADLYDLTEAEQELLLSRKRGHALFMVGAKRLHIQFDIPEYKFKYMGAAGGR